MACVIAAPSSSSGKTLLSLILISWARVNGQTIQPFKVGPDYLDPQLLTKVSQRPCRNLDLILSNKHWIQDSFYRHGGKADMAIIEGVMGLFDGIGSTDKGSTASIAKELKLPVVLTINSRGQAASLAALVKGFRDQDPQLKLAGVVVNQVNTQRHKNLLKEVLQSINVKMLGSLPSDPMLTLPNRYLGLTPAHEINDIEKRVEAWVEIAKNNLDLEIFKHLLKAPLLKKEPIFLKANESKKKTSISQYPIAIAEDKAFHFRYPETKEYLEELGMPLITWKPTENESIPIMAKGLIIPGGFPEQHAEQISAASNALNSLKSFYGKGPIYAECGGMLLLGNSIKDQEGTSHPMAGLLPFDAKKGKLQIGYRQLIGLSNTLILKKGDKLNGHEFHHWEIKPNSSTNSKEKKHNLSKLWTMSGWDLNSEREGWGNKHIHASWIHLHWPSSSKILNLWLKSIKNAKSK